MKIPYISPSELVSRYGFMCRSTAHQPFNSVQIIEEDLRRLEHLIKVDLVNLSRKESPSDFIEVYTAMLHELDRFKMFCIYPATATKFVVAIGGAFSAGKSSLINKLLGVKLLPSDIAKVTSQPTFVLHGSKNEIHALNLHGHPILLSESEFASLKHGKGGELEKYGSQIAGILQNVFITRTDFKWENLAISDTPGYNPDDSHSHGRLDAQLAQSQLNAANAIIWTVDINKGTMTTSDMQFLGALSPEIPLLVVLTKADSKPNADVEKVLLEVRNKLSQYGIPVVDVIAVSTRASLVNSINSITKYFNKWNASKAVPTFARNFSILFSRYSNYLDSERAHALAQLGYVNKILAQQNVGGLEPIHDAAKDRIAVLENEVFPLLKKIEFDFFSTLKKAYAKVGKLPICPILQPAPKSTLLHAGRVWLYGIANKQHSAAQEIEIYSTSEQFDKFVPEEFWQQWSDINSKVIDKTVAAKRILEKKYSANDDGTITDDKTKHVWKRIDAAKAKNYHWILKYLAVFVLGGSVVFGYFSLFDNDSQLTLRTFATKLGLDLTPTTK
ncbi:MAG: dynamin family protein [Hydrogenophaga sp.]|uniref:dynamin family protein n=1 Tax=Hydrogenophaga sp. TaxID=1904254 RepID=UPI002716F6E1|nr:dynamin family protein [Hydrogenophaga sp.]MDO9571805.1 dynamin family protein [Hydrogenophaga sp.]